MITEITRTNLAEIRNPALAAHAEIYVRIYEDFLQQVRGMGLPLAEEDGRPAAEAQLAHLQANGAVVRNERKSVYLNAISPACLACQTGRGSATFFVSLRCHRNCFYCFNPNQEEYTYYTTQQRDVAAELTEAAARGQKATHLALTGGEPLLYPQETIRFFQTAAEKFPGAYTRLYTCGDHLTAEILRDLRAAGLDEIRFSIRMHDLEKGHRQVFDQIALAKGYIPSVMVEMPVLPGTTARMQEVLLELERMEISSINLLEFCFPYANVAEFNRRGYTIKARPYRVLYNYWYAGGLPVAGSESVCLELLAFARERGLKIGVHYCSLENKHTGQVYQQNHGQKPGKAFYFSQRDFFWKSAKVFGADVATALEAFKKKGFSDYQLDSSRAILEFHPKGIFLLRRLDLEVGICYSIFENRPGGQVRRELKVDLARAQDFDLHTDV